MKKLSQSYILAEEQSPVELEETLLWDRAEDGCKVFRGYQNLGSFEACRATSAAATFFDRFQRTSQGVRQTFVDGAFAYNNPVSRVRQEVIDLRGDRDVLLISIEIGDKPDSSMGSLKGLLIGIVDIVLATETADRQFKALEEGSSRIINTRLDQR
ncbi:uncharacterized protein DFL_002994 [Arthrobotrys flagrans]|uniref:PNPLA domain-containing protein n=1 Tax=Arthrobotrys flagrans TaxID=97331 RepID=A0A437ACI0_ARTFL|nr:hypothetical protein DFL_002994 [Arthrobotrys flagrans]